MKIKLLGKNLEELKRLVADEGLPGFTARQIAQWLYVKKVRSIDDMTNLSKTARPSAFRPSRVAAWAASAA